VKSISGGLFYECYSLIRITLPDSVTGIGERAFYHCHSLTNITIPCNVTSIGEYAYCGCSSPREIVLPDGVTKIGEYAFSECTSLTNITIPESVTSIGKNAFGDTNWLKQKQNENPLVTVNHILIDGKTCSGEVTIPKGVMCIGDSAFSECTGLTDITIPESVTSIDKHAFYRCSSLKEITLPERVTSIGKGAFSECGSLREIVIPDSVTDIGYGALGRCGALCVIRLRPDDTKFYRDYSTLKNLSEELQKVFEMHRTFDYSGKAKTAVKYPVLAADYLRTHDERLAVYIRVHLTEMMESCIPAGDTRLIAELTQSDAFFNEKNIDKCIKLAQENGQQEIFMLLMNYKKYRSLQQRL